MIFIIIIAILVSLSLILSKSHEQTDNKTVNKLKKIILSAIYFVIFFITYYFIVALITMIPLAFLSKNADSDTGLWAYGIILGMILSPVLSLITTRKILKRKEKITNGNYKTY